MAVRDAADPTARAINVRFAWMADLPRVRSLYPGLATDEEYMALSHAAARILPLLWCECDDQGVFQWKPKTLKMALLPTHNDDMVAILAELAERRFVRRVEIDGKSYGLVRNFRRYQHPKSPRACFPLPAELRSYVGLDVSDGEAAPVERGGRGR